MKIDEVISAINDELDPYTNKIKSKHTSICKCDTYFPQYKDEFTIERIGKFSMSDEIFLFEQKPALMIHELIKRIKYFLSQHLYGMNLHYRVKKQIWGIEYEFFKVYEF